jgi:hypothetical protein
MPEIKYLQVLVMPNGEIICLGKKIGFINTKSELDYGKYIFSIDTDNCQIIFNNVITKK